MHIQQNALPTNSIIFACLRANIEIMYQPLVSIVTIVYNGEQYLEQTIQSVLQQTYPHIEYIVIDGGSKDNSVDIIKKYQSRIAYWVSEKDEGVSDAFNKGIGKAKGEIIGLINADDWYEPYTVEKVVHAMEQADVAFGDLRYYKNGEKDMVVIGSHDFLPNEMSVNHPTVFVKSSCYKKYGMFMPDYKYAMDYDLMLRLKIKGCRFIHIPEVLANMRWEGLSDQQWHKACKEVLSIKNKYLPNKAFLNKLYFHKQVASIKLSRFLHRIHLTKTVRFYRQWLSPVRKRYD
jgi:glycosyltransferase involved in cell wall biosynthesis